MTDIGKFPKRNNSCFRISLMGKLRCVERAEMFRSTIDNDSGRISAGLIRLSHSFREGSFSATHVLRILRFGRDAKVLQRIIEAVAIHMVYEWRLGAVNHLPDDSMSRVDDAIHTQYPVVGFPANVVRAASSLLTGMSAVPTPLCPQSAASFAEMTIRQLFPCQNTCLGVVAEALEKVALIGQTACGHWSLPSRISGKGGVSVRALASPAQFAAFSAAGQA